MNHFLYPEAPSPDQATTLYGNVATRTLIRIFLEQQSTPKNIEAMIFGGSAPASMKETYKISNKNIAIAKTILEKAGIRTGVEDVGGTWGRKIIFNASTGESVVYRVERLRDGDWYPYIGMR